MRHKKDFTLAVSNALAARRLWHASRRKGMPAMARFHLRAARAFIAVARDYRNGR